MKIIVFSFIIIAWAPLYAPPLVFVANKELNASKEFVRLERIQQTNLYSYVKFVKARYILTKEIVWLSDKMPDAIELQTSMLILRKNDEN